MEGDIMYWANSTAGLKHPPVWLPATKIIAPRAMATDRMIKIVFLKLLVSLLSLACMIRNTNQKVQKNSVNHTAESVATTKLPAGVCGLN